MQAMIFAAGLGTRLKPLTDSMPKALVRVGGKPLIEHVIMKLKDAGVGRIVVNVHHFAGQIKSFLAANDNFGVDIRVSDESEMLLETGGGIKKAAPLFSPDEPVLIHNVDILSNVDLRKFYDSSTGNDATLLVSDRKTRRYLLFDDGMTLRGWTNVETGEVKMKNEECRMKNDNYNNEAMPCGCVNDNSSLNNNDNSNEALSGVCANDNSSFFILHSSFKKFAFSGIHIFSPRLFPLLENYSDKFGIMDFYLGADSGANIKGYLKNDLRLMDVGKLDTLKDAEEFLKECDM